MDVPAPIWTADANARDRGRYWIPGLGGEELLGDRLLPAFHLTAALPPTGDVRVHVEVLEMRRLAHGLQNLSVYGSDPVAAPAADAPALGARALDAFQQETGWQRADRLGYIQYRNPGWAAGVRVMPLRILPVRWEASGALVVAQRVRVRVEFPVGRDPDPKALRQRIPVPQTRGRSDSLTRLLARSVINPHQVAIWTTHPLPVTPRSADDLTRPEPTDGFSTATSPWLRIAIAERGVYVLTADDLRAHGVDPATVPLEELRLFCGPTDALPESLWVDELPTWMDPCALWIDGAEDDVWGDETRVYFVGNGPDGWCQDRGLTAYPEDRYYVHPWSADFIYWLCWGGVFTTAPVRVAEQDADPAGLQLHTTAEVRLHLEENNLHETRPREEGLLWERFFWRWIREGSHADLDVHLPGAVPGSPAEFRIALWGASWIRHHDLADHAAEVTIDGQALGSVEWNWCERAVVEGSVAVSADSMRVTIAVPRRDDGSGGWVRDTSNLAWVEATYDRELFASEDSLAFFLPAEIASDHALRITDLADSSGWLLLDATDFREPVRLLPRISADPDSGYLADFRVDTGPRDGRPLRQAEYDRHLVLLRPAEARSPAEIRLEVWEGSSLRESTEAVDYLIVTGGEFLDAAEELAAHRRVNFSGAAGDSVQEARVAVVTIERVFDEFAWGQHDPAALRSFVAHARRYWNGGGPEETLSHLLLLGNAYRDARGYLGGGDPDQPGGGARDVVPSHTFFDWYHQYHYGLWPAFASDDWFTFLDGPEDEIHDIAVGRLPVGSLEEARQIVGKIVAYESAPTPERWRTRLLFAADDICQGPRHDPLGFVHMLAAERLSQDLAPNDAPQEKVYLYEYGSECAYSTKPEATQDLLSLLEAGALLFNFTGHADDDQLADERLMRIPEFEQLGNAGRPFLMFSASCEAGLFDHGGNSIALAAVRHAEGGALAVIASSAPALSTPNALLNQAFYETLFPDRSLIGSAAFGPSLLAAKWRGLRGIASHPNDLLYNLLGDPGSRFVAPTCRMELQVSQLSKGDPPPEEPDSVTLIRGAPVMITGRILDSAGAPMPQFEGEAEIEVYDSEIERHPEEHPYVSYRLPGASIFRGRADVVAGEIDTVRFFVPTRLWSGPRGPARICAYAEEAAGSRGAPSAVGALSDLWISDSVATCDDETAPLITLAWEFPGEMVIPGSRLVITLNDESGIYVAADVSGAGVILTVCEVDGPMLGEVDLSAEVLCGADYREATVTYTLPADLPQEVPLHLEVQADDNVGQRGSAELFFEIRETEEVTGQLLLSVFNIPNPTPSETHFLFEISRIADLEITIFTSTGRAICRLTGDLVSPDDARSAGLHWNGRDDDGDLPANGVYFYRAMARDAAGSTGILIERLVVLR